MKNTCTTTRTTTMMRTTLFALLLACATGASQQAAAQSQGLRLTTTPYGLSLSAPEGGLRLNLSLPGDTRQFGPLFAPATTTTAATAATAAPAQNGIAPTLTFGDRGTLSADWLDLGKGFRSSVGLSWRQPQALNLERTLRGETDSGGPATTPYLSFGWRGEPFRNSGWKMSAEVGAYFSGSGECRSDQYCLRTRSAGLNPNANTSGIRWSPFISFGATLSY